MIIQHNMAAANTNRQLGITNGNLAKSTEKLNNFYIKKTLILSDY